MSQKPTKRRTRGKQQGYNRTDVGNSLRFTTDHAHRLIYVEGPGWHAWDGKRWRLDNESAPYQAAKETAWRIRREAMRIEDREEADKMFSWALKSESNAHIKAMVDLARRGERNTRGLLTPITALDSHPHLLVCANGTINLKTGRLTTHDPSHYLTRLVNVGYDPKAKAPRWEQFLDEVFQGDAEMIGYVQRAVGYSLTAETREQVMLIAHGVGANGKSVFMETVADVAGEWSANAAADTFVASGRGSSIPSDLARMRGTRLVRVPETEDGAALARQIIKRITGGDTITARGLYREWFEYVPVFKVWLVTNHLPAIPHNDYATWRRIRVLPFARRFEPREQDKHLRRALRKELPGILTWAVRGARDWYRLGLGDAPFAAAVARDDYHRQQDTVSRWLDEDTVDDSEARTLKTELYGAYSGWCKSVALPALSRAAFYQALESRGYPSKKNKDGDRLHEGLRLQ